MSKMPGKPSSGSTGKPMAPPKVATQKPGGKQPAMKGGMKGGKGGGGRGC